MTTEAAEKKNFWLKLDNAAKIFPGQNSSTWSNSFRVAFELDRTVDPDILLRALNDIMPRFDCYKVRIRRGFFWFYLETNKKPLLVSADIKNPCHRVKFSENNNYLFKIYYYGSRIALDCYHVLTDGHGGAVLLSTLAAQYLRLTGENIPAGDFVLDINTSTTPAELEDSFVKNADSKAKYNRRNSFVYHPTGEKMPSHMVNITSGFMSFEQLHALTQKNGVTLTEYLTAVMISVLIEKQKNEKRRQKEISVQIPVDLRRSFGSETLRNFTICLSVRVNPEMGEYTFEELLTLVKYKLRLVNNRKEHNMMITANMGLERNPLIRAVPLAVKNLGVSLSFFFTAEKTTSCLLTNLGRVKLPEEMNPHVKKIIFMPAPGKLNAARIGVATAGDSLAVTFSNAYRESDIEKAFFTFLVKQGIHVKIESNRE